MICQAGGEIDLVGFDMQCLDKKKVNSGGRKSSDVIGRSVIKLFRIMLDSGVWSFMERAVQLANANCAAKLANKQAAPSGPSSAISDLVAEITKEKTKIHVDVRPKLQA